jgi:hypothetical protein
MVELRATRGRTLRVEADAVVARPRTYRQDALGQRQGMCARLRLSDRRSGARARPDLQSQQPATASRTSAAVAATISTSDIALKLRG